MTVFALRGILGFKSGAILVSLCWVAILVHIIDRKWWQASVWALIAAVFSAVGVIHVPVSGPSPTPSLPDRTDGTGSLLPAMI